MNFTNFTNFTNLMWFPIAASVLTITLKWFAFSVTGSVGFL